MKFFPRKKTSPWQWVPSLYVAQSLPYSAVMIVSVIMYKRLGISNTEIALYTSWLYLPWIIKPLWSPFVDIFKTKRWWVLTTQLIMGAGLAGIALTIPADNFLRYTIAVFWLIAFNSATHDIAADGFYLLALSGGDQSYFVGIRSTFYRLGMIFCQGVLIVFAGYLETHTGLEPLDIEFKTANTLIEQDYETFENSDFLVSGYNTSIELASLESAKADSIKKYYSDLNIENGFTFATETGQDKNSGANSEKGPGEITKIFESFLKLFAPEKRTAVKNKFSGNIGVIAVTLKNRPAADEALIINFDHSSGDKNFSVIEGQRLNFTRNNWNKKAFALVQTDPGTGAETAAGFIISSGNIRFAWVVTFAVLAILMLLLMAYHYLFLPVSVSDIPLVKENISENMREFGKTFISFFTKGNVRIGILFLLTYRLGESQLVKLAAPFLLDSREAGGLALSTGEVGLIYGTIGLIALSAGGILGGIAVSAKGMKYWLWWMMIAINLPNTVYIFLSYTMPDSFTVISSCVAVEQFGYGFGFTAYMMYMILMSEGEHKTAHFAITTGFMALGMMLPGMISGWVEDIIGYRHFFIWVMIATVPAFLIAKFIKIDPGFGKKEE